MNRQSFDNRNRLSWWFHRLPSDILVPKTCVVNYPDNDLIDLLDGQHPEGFHHLCLTIIDIGHEWGWPLFLRTDYLSGKHSWKDTFWNKLGFIRNAGLGLTYNKIAAYRSRELRTLLHIFDGRL